VASEEKGVGVGEAVACAAGAAEEYRKRADERSA